MKALALGNKQVKADVTRIAGVYGPEGWVPDSAQALCARVLSTVYMGMEVSNIFMAVDGSCTNGVASIETIIERNPGSFKGIGTRYRIITS